MKASKDTFVNLKIFCTPGSRKRRGKEVVLCYSYGLEFLYMYCTVLYSTQIIGGSAAEIDTGTVLYPVLLYSSSTLFSSSYLRVTFTVNIYCITVLYLYSTPLARDAGCSAIYDISSMYHSYSFPPCPWCWLLCCWRYQYCTTLFLWSRST